VIGDPWYEAAHAVSAYARADEFDLLHDHTGPVGASIGAMRDGPTVHTCMGRSPSRPRCCIGASPTGTGSWPSPSASGPWPPRTCAGPGWSTTASPPTATPTRRARATTCCSWAGRRLILCVTTKNQRERAYWAEQVEPLLGEDVQVRGECDQEQKTRLLAGAAGLLFPIQWPEPFGLVMGEAMACGTPGGGLAERVGARGGGRRVTGFIVESVEEMAAAVDRGELDPGAMRARVTERFSAEAMVAGYERAYQQVLNSRQ
jgi:glycosyltransferase involved in cell wall biosynthesis